MMISYYELLELIKERKQPDKVKYESIIFTWKDIEYYSGNGSSLLTMLEHDFTSKGLIMHKNIEIIEDKPKKIEKLMLNGEPIGFGTMNKWLGYPITNNEIKICSAIEGEGVTINELVKAVNYLLEVDKHE